MINKRVLCYGDSITWGYNPATQNRMSENKRWTGVLKKGLGDDYTVIEEGLNGRTTLWDDPLNGYSKNGLTYLKPCIDSHKPFDLFILLLGTNDLKKRFSLPSIEIAEGIDVILNVVENSDTGRDGLAPEILLISPPYLNEETSFSDEFRNSYNKSQKLPDYYEKIAINHKCYFLDSSKIIVASKLDGVHPEVDQHLILGKAIIDKVKEIMDDTSF
jgi:lysophospholipase L1-like esterase